MPLPLPLPPCHAYVSSCFFLVTTTTRCEGACTERRAAPRVSGSEALHPKVRGGGWIVGHSFVIRSSDSNEKKKKINRGGAAERESEREIRFREEIERLRLINGASIPSVSVLLPPSPAFSSLTHSLPRQLPLPHSLTRGYRSWRRRPPAARPRCPARGATRPRPRAPRPPRPCRRRRRRPRRPPRRTARPRPRPRRAA